MLNGRHLILLGGIASAGLLSVREGQRQIGVCYQIATVEKEIRGVKSKIQLSKIEHLALQSPRAVSHHATDLRLAVAPVNPFGIQTPAPSTGPRNTNTPRRSAPPAPAVPVLPGSTPPLMDRTACR